MKTNYFLKTLAVAGFVFLAMNLSANVINVKANGTDSDLADALGKAQTGDTLVISGKIAFNNPVTITTNVYIMGKAGDGSDFFDGQGKSKIFEIDPEPVDGYGLTFENLGFTGGYNTKDDGGVGRIIGGKTEFVRCWFEANYSANRGGVLFLANATTVVRFAACSIDSNTSYNEGAFVFGTGGVDMKCEYCTISGNQNIHKRGAAVYLQDGTYSFFYTLISGNTAGESMDQKAEGGTIVSSSSNQALTMESCAVISNTTYDHGTAFFSMVDPNITLINTTVARNHTMSGAGSWFIANDGPGIDITLVNVSYVDNISDDNAGNAGGGIRVMNLNNRINVFNSIIARNTCNDGGAIDMGVNATPNIAKDFVFKNSIVGFIGGLPIDTIPAAKDNPKIPTTSLINMYHLSDNDGVSQKDYVSMDKSGVDFIDNMVTTTYFGMPYYTLNKGGYAATLGDPALLAALDTKTDQLLVDRKIASDGSIFAGSVQSVVDGAEFDDTGCDKDIKPIYYPVSSGSGIHTPSVATTKGISIIGVPSNGILGVNFGDVKGRSIGTLLNINGQEVEKVFDLNVVSKGYYNIHVAPGMYILKVVNGGNTYAQKLVVMK